MILRDYMLTALEGHKLSNVQDQDYNNAAIQQDCKNT